MIKSKGIISFKGNLSFLFLFLLLNGFAQPSFRFFTTADGMASNQIYNLYRDSKGFLWMGHSLGLTRFDGNRFTDYSTPDQNSLGITNIHEDKNGTLWCHNFGGQIFYIKNNVLKVFEKYNWKTQQSFPSITISGNNELIASHIEGIYVYSIDDGKDTILGREKNLGLFFNYGFASIRGNIYNILESSLFRITRDSLVPIKAQSAPTLKEKKGHLIIGSFKDSIYLLNNDRSEVIVVQVMQNSYRISRSFDAPEGAFIISVPNDDEAWICGKKIAFCINDPSKKIENINVTSLVSDKENNLWISTLQNGIGLWKSLNQNTQDIQTGNNLNEIINTLNLWQNKLVSGSSLGRLGFYDSTGRIIQTINLSDNLSIAALKSSNNNTLLLGTNFLKEFSSAGSTLKTISTNSAIKSICQDSMGNYYVANAYSLDKVLPDGKLFKIRLKRCYSVDYSRSMNTVYTAFIDGVFAYNGKKLFELKPNGKSIYSPSLLVNGEDLFVATISDGIYWFKKNIFHKHLSTANGLLNDHILKIKNYNEILWILTNKSIEEWDYKKNQLNHHSFGDDLSLSNISDFVIWKNRIWAAYGHTIKILPIKSNKNFPPKVFIDYILVNNKDTLNTDALNLDYQQNKLTFVLSGLSMYSGNNLRFAYRLQGEKEPWKMVPANNFIIDFPGLRPGRYEFEVKAIGSDGTHGEAKIIPINIALPWWLKPWFLAIALFLFVAITFLIFSARLRSVRNTNRLVLEKVNLESQWQKSMLTAIRSQMNPHFIFNALNTIQSYIYTNNKDKASNYMGKFSDLIRRILDYSGKEKISLAKEIEMLQLYIDLEMLRFENSLKSHIHVDEALNTESIFIPPMLIQPFVENAIKHGLLHKPDDRLLELRFEPDAKSKYLLISIEDNGIGRAKSREINLAKAGFHTSFAMEANSKRIEMLNLTSGQKFQMEIIDKKDKNGRSLGTLVVLKIEL